MTPKGRRKNWIPVVAGFLRKNDLLLVGQRPLKNGLPGQWEFPGGKIEHGESPEEALKRELCEELAIDAEIGDLKLSITHHYEETGIILLFFEVLYWRGEPKPVHHMNIRWVTSEELKAMDIPEANRRAFDRLISAIKESHNEKKTSTP